MCWDRVGKAGGKEWKMGMKKKKCTCRKVSKVKFRQLSAVDCGKLTIESSTDYSGIPEDRLSF